MGHSGPAHGVARVEGFWVGVALIFVGNWATLVGTILIVTFGPLIGGFLIVQPNEARVLTLFGRYNGSVTEAGLWWRDPFDKRKKISLRVRNFESDRIKVNDASGNPIEIAAVIVWRVTDTARAMFDVADHEQLRDRASETSLRHLANQYPTTTTSPRRHRCARRRRGSRRAQAETSTSRSVTAGNPDPRDRPTHLADAPKSPRPCCAASRPSVPRRPLGRSFRAGRSRSNALEIGRQRSRRARH